MRFKTIYRLLYNRRKRTSSKDGKYPIEIEAYLPIVGERKFLPTSIRVRPEEWSERDKRVNHKNLQYITLNSRIKELIDQFEEIENRYWSEKIPFHLKYLENEPKVPTQLSFTIFWENYIKTNPKRLRTNSIKTKKTALAHFKAYRQDVLFVDLTLELLYDYVNHLHGYTYTEKGENLQIQNGFIHTLLKDFKAVLNVAIHNGLFPMEKNPFLRFSIQKYARPSDQVKYLTPEEIKMIEELEIDERHKHLVKIKDFFLLGIYTGLRYGDLIRLNKSHINESNGQMTISLIQEKTGGLVNIPLSKMFQQKGTRIINTYIKSDRPMIFDDLTNPYVNRELKVIAKMAGIYKKLTMHMARHSCGTFHLSLGLPIEFVQRIMGHENLRSTQVYAKITDKALENALDKLNY